MLPPFHIRNLRPFSASQDTLVRINAPCYDDTISRHPAATLKYYDEDDGDLITLGSSGELTEKLQEPVFLPSSGPAATMQHASRSSEHHVFEIDDCARVQSLWQILQSSSKDSDGVTVAQDQGDVMKWSAEKKDRLAIFYERHRAEIWSPIAKELGVSWESVDAMHWALGKKDMARRAYERNAHSEQSGSSEESIKTKPNSTYSAPGTQQFEDYRVHHFNATRPPQVELPMSVKTPGQASLPNVSNVDLDRSASSTMGKKREGNSVMEGKRHAQPVGEKLRSRMTAVDSHQNRWTDYKPSSLAFLPASTSLNPAFDGPGLTSEGRRQAQVAGDKLRWRTNPIRHSRPSRVGASEHAISKNRWSSYSGTRAARFDERQNAQDEATNTSSTTDEEEVPNNGQLSLLEVFEAELAKEVPTTNSEEALGFESPVAQTPVPNPANQVNSSSESQDHPSPHGSQGLLGLINEHLHERTAGDVALSQDFSTAIDRGIRGLGACMQSIGRGLQEVSSVSRQAADRTRNADLQLIDDAVLVFQSLTGGFTAALGRHMAANRPGTASASRNGSAEGDIGSRPTALGPSDGKDPEEDAVTVRKSHQYHSKGGDGPSEIAYITRPDHATAPRYISGKPASPQLEIESQSRSAPAMSKKPRFHKPGPIHLPNHPGYVDHLRQSQSVRTFEELCNIQRANSPPLDARFPTLAQFEGENFGAAPTFPALPDMQPLVPERAPCQNMHGTRYEEPKPSNGSLPLLSSPSSAEGSRQSHDSVNGRYEHSAQQKGHEVIPLSRLSSAARLAEPFDPLEAEPSARPHLTEGLRRNATIASTDIRRAARRRRPYSEVFDGSGRVPWTEFLQENVRERRGHYRASDDKGRPPSANQEHPQRLPRPETRSRRSPFAAAGYDDQHHDDSTVGKINDCVEQLRELGFGGEDSDSAGRLLVYAQAAEGVLVDAIDLIEEEQRAWQRL